MNISEIEEHRLECARRAFNSIDFEGEPLKFGIKKVEDWENMSNSYSMAIPVIVSEKNIERNDNVVLYVDFKDHSIELDHQVSGEAVTAYIESTGVRVGKVPDVFYDLEKINSKEIMNKFNKTRKITI